MPAEDGGCQDTGQNLREEEGSSYLGRGGGSGSSRELLQTPVKNGRGRKAVPVSEELWAKS